MSTLANVKTGDILAWKRDRVHFTSDLLIRLICFLTGEKYGHIGIALRMFDRVFVFEASYPVVKISLLNTKEEVYHIEMNQEPSEEALAFLFSTLGYDYSILDDFRALFGYVSKKDSKWQCAELTREYSRIMGTELKCEDIPGELVDYLTVELGKKISLLEESV